MRTVIFAYDLNREQSKKALIQGREQSFDFMCAYKIRKMQSAVYDTERCRM